MEMLFYFGKSLVVAAAFYLVYLLVLKKLTFFNLNRSFLLLALAATALVPALHFTTRATVPMVLERLPVREVVVQAPLTMVQGAGIPSPLKNISSINYADWARIAYWVIAAMPAVRLLVSIAKVLLMAYRQGYRRGRLRVVNNRQGFNFSFFNLVFLDGSGLTDTERRQVFLHEALHCRLGHSADNLLAGVMKAFFWFNPLVYLLSRELRLTHEYQVDEALTSSRDAHTGGYVNLLLKIASRPSGSLVNTFGSGSLKGRVKMLMQRRSVGARRWVYPAMLVLLAPLCLGMMVQKVLPAPAGDTENQEYLTAKKPQANGAEFKPTQAGKSAGQRKAAAKTRVSTNFKLALQGKVHKDYTGLRMLSSDTLIKDSVTSTFHMRGHAVAQIGNTIIRANYIRFALKDKVLFASKVRVQDIKNPDDKTVIYGDSLRWDLKTQRVLSYNAHQE